MTVAASPEVAAAFQKVGAMMLVGGIRPTGEFISPPDLPLFVENVYARVPVGDITIVLHSPTAFTPLQTLWFSLQPEAGAIAYDVGFIRVVESGEFIVGLTEDKDRAPAGAYSHTLLDKVCERLNECP